MEAMRFIFLIIQFVLFALGGGVIFWSFICFFGGPGGKIGTQESIGLGFVLVITGCILIIAGKIVPNMKYTKEWKQKKGKWVQKHKHSNGKSYWLIHYIQNGTEYSSGEYTNEKNALEDLEKYNT